jgi:6-pyruvoyltetrahydropterin/6-carboxytetrahydropterin synthase
MVCDFKQLNWVKKFLDEVLDHKFILDINDPVLSEECRRLFFKEVDTDLIPNILVSHPEQYYTVNMTKFKEIWSKLHSSVFEVYEGIVLVDFVPTSENLTQWLYRIIDKKMKKINIQIESVQFFETEKSQSIYSE